MAARGFLPVDLHGAIHKKLFSLAGYFSLKTKQICIWSAFCKHGWILLKVGI
jgi:hypothetical protein